jgi:hypothetical protein
MFRRALFAWVATGLLLAACSNDDGGGSDATATAPSTDATPDLTTPVATADTSSEAETTDADAADDLDGDGLSLGVIAPSPGLLSTVFRATERGVELAADDIASSGGVLDGPLAIERTVAPLDGNEAEVVPAAVDGGADALIGPTGSTDALAYLDAVTASRSISCSATASAPGLTDSQESFGLFRTALPDEVVVSYLADVIEARRDADAEGAASRVAIVARSDDYGLSVGNGLAATLEALGFEPTVVDYAARRVNFVGTADAVTSLAPDDRPGHVLPAEDRRDLRSGWRRRARRRAHHGRRHRHPRLPATAHGRRSERAGRRRRPGLRLCGRAGARQPGGRGRAVAERQRRGARGHLGRDDVHHLR